MSTTFDAIAGILAGQFHVEPDRIQPESALSAIGLDSLTLMEFVFAVEDHFGLRIPEERLDPRQAGLTLADLCRALEQAGAQVPAPEPAP